MSSPVIHLIVFLLLAKVFSSLAMTKLEYAPAPPDNPLKGFVPYIDMNARERFPHSMVFHYFSFRDLMTGDNEFDWSPIEEKLTVAQESGCQMIFRVTLEYPGKPLQVPRFLIDEGVKVTTWKRDDSDPGVCHTPDYNDSRLHIALLQFITALGKRYDGDHRVGFLTAGLLGLWGEWHNYPREDLMASQETQKLVLDAYEKSFTKTPILLRYPAQKGHNAYIANANRPFGYHDDSFNWATLDTGRKQDDWFFIPLLKEAEALLKWKKHPIGGELRPELWKTSFTEESHHKAQGFEQCVLQTHVSWLMDSGLFSEKYPLPVERKRIAIKAAQLMGYEFYVTGWEWQEGAVTITVENRGVAPFYHDWPVELAVREKVIAHFDLRGILPGETRRWTAAADAEGPFRLRVANPMPGGRPLRFANKEQEKEWLVLLAD